MISSFKKLKIAGKSVDDAIVAYVSKFGGIIATMDVELKGTIKKKGGSILSLANDRIILEP